MDDIFSDFLRHPTFGIVVLICVLLLLIILFITILNYIRITRMERDFNDLKVILFGRTRR
jgi:hypothetical protein